VFVTLDDISAGGCCIVRKGRLELANGDNVVIDVWSQDIEMKLSIPARVCWCSHQGASSRAGLRFVETNHRLLRQIEAYVERFHHRGEDSRPQAWIPSRSVSAGDEPQLPPPPQAPVPPQLAPEFLLEFAPPSVPESSRRSPSSPRRGRPSLRASQRRLLPAMPRPQRLRAVDLQRRMQPAHRHEVARIAEETGIHIHTLYGWLRTLRLEGEVNPERPLDPEAWSATDKVSTLLQVAALSAAERSTYCSRHGISLEQLERWRQAALQANEKPLLILRAEEELQRLQGRDQREIRRLQKEQRRLLKEQRHFKRSAAINAELLAVVRKLQILWEQGEDP
jgi:Tfp pilus assembly protein PilZ